MSVFIGNVTFDCRDPDRMAVFWAAALGYEKQESDAPGKWGAANHPATRHPRLYFQRVPEPKTVKNRVHIDINADDMETEVSRLVSLGATKLRVEVNEYDETCTVMQDVEGNEFCVQPSE